MGDSEALPVHGLGHASDAFSNAIYVKQKLAARMLNPTGIHQHPRWVKDRVDVGQCGFQNRGCLANLGIKRLDGFIKPFGRMLVAVAAIGFITAVVALIVKAIRSP